MNTSQSPATQHDSNLGEHIGSANVVVEDPNGHSRLFALVYLVESMGRRIRQKQAPSVGAGRDRRGLDCLVVPIYLGCLLYTSDAADE